MAPVTMPPDEEARSIFRSLGYSVSGNGSELRAERKWRTVHVTALDADEATANPVRPDGGSTGDIGLRCFVTWKGYTGDLTDRLRRLDPPYEWAVIGVEDADRYEVVNRSETVA
ncbi:MAG: hypothetical protein ABEJ78_08475 [Haloferacaceae archaeon]